MTFQAGEETLSRTTLGGITVGSLVNCERAMRLGDRLGGHLVSGHIDAVGEVTRRTDDADWSKIFFSAPPQLMRQMVSKGSIAVDGVSLTLVDVTDTEFSVALIPHTLAVTTLGTLRVGDRVNLETDLLAKYVQRQLETAHLVREG
jgi:riboflavin synthase